MKTVANTVNAVRKIRADLDLILSDLHDAGRVLFDGDAAREAFAALPDTVTIYRGTVQGKERTYGVHWTLNREVALRYTTKSGRLGNPVILSTKVRKSDIGGLIFGNVGADLFNAPPVHIEKTEVHSQFSVLTVTNSTNRRFAVERARPDYHRRFLDSNSLSVSWGSLVYVPTGAGSMQCGGLVYIYTRQGSLAPTHGLIGHRAGIDFPHDQWVGLSREQPLPTGVINVNSFPPPYQVAIGVYGDWAGAATAANCFYVAYLNAEFV